MEIFGDSVVPLDPSVSKQWEEYKYKVIDGYTGDVVGYTNERPAKICTVWDSRWFHYYYTM